MKKIATIILCLGFCFPLIAQEEEEEKSVYGLYTWTHEVLMTVCDMNGDEIRNEMPRNSMVGQKFRVLKDTGDAVLIRVVDHRKILYHERSWAAQQFLNERKHSRIQVQPEFYKYNVRNHSEFTSLDAEKRNREDFDEIRILFKVPKSYLKDHARSEEYRRPNIAIGAINFPFKMRFQDGRRDFSGAFNLGVGVGMSLRQKDWKKNDYYVLIGTGITEINLVASEVGRNADLLQDVNGLTALTISMGFMIQREKTQIGLFYGWDHLSAGNHATYDWKQQARPWVSLAIGYAIFSGEGKKENTDSTQ